MKMILISVLLVSVSCGKFATNKDLNKANDRIAKLDKRLKELENDFSVIHSELENTKNNAIQTMSEMTDLQVVIDSLQNNQAAQNLLITDLQTKQYQIVHLDAMVNMLQSQLDTVQLKLTELELEDRVTEMVDPCPNSMFAGYAEVLMRTSSGTYVAYFENGQKRHLTVLKKNTLYKTTDDRNCKFKINNDNEVEQQ
jgi:peptidoglycan hydrolase CwlO-like protein